MNSYNHVRQYQGVFGKRNIGGTLKLLSNSVMALLFPLDCVYQKHDSFKTRITDSTPSATISSSSLAFLLRVNRL